ncbi:MAG: hypothetical protein MJZ29_01300 [Bacteroidaceae bacterium]|nr:hypothetical protein [Bacteroidaceae bacterium]
MNILRSAFMLATSLAVSTIVSAQSVVDASTIHLTERRGWYIPAECPVDLKAEHDKVESEKMRLEFFGWSPENDYPFTLKFPTDKTYRKCFLQYRMSGAPRPADWDMLTEIQVFNPKDGLWYEISRVVTPYGGSFNSLWSKAYYFDVTEFLPLLQNPDGTKFRIYYGGFDATEKKAHAATLIFHLYEGTPDDGPVVYTAQVYDSFRNGNNGYRAWAYGVKGHSIEADERLGKREIDIPENVHSGWLRVCFTGHGQEAINEAGDNYATVMPYFPNRAGYEVNNPAEFDINTYAIRLHGEQAEQTGLIWEKNDDNYSQAGTYQYDRAGWGPGKPANVHWWYVENLPAGGKWNIDIDLEEYVSNRTVPNAAYVANYYVSATLFGLEQATSGITEHPTTSPSKDCFKDLTGRTVTNPEPNRIYIRNNKKVIYGK